MSRAGLWIGVAVAGLAILAAGGFLVLDGGGRLADLIRGRDARWVEYSCRGTKQVTERVGSETVAHTAYEVTERVFMDAVAIHVLRSDGRQADVTRFKRDATMAEWRLETQDPADDGKSESSVGNFFFGTLSLVIRDIETARSGEWDMQRSSLLNGTCHVARDGRY